MTLFINERVTTDKSPRKSTLFPIQTNRLKHNANITMQLAQSPTYQDGITWCPPFHEAGFLEYGSYLIMPDCARLPLN